MPQPVDVAEARSTLDHIPGGQVIAGSGMGRPENAFSALRGSRNVSAPKSMSPDRAARAGSGCGVGPLPR